MASREIRIELKVQQAIWAWTQDCLEAPPLSTLQAVCFLSAHSYSYCDAETGYCEQQPLVCTALQKHWKKVLRVFSSEDRGADISDWGTADGCQKMVKNSGRWRARQAVGFGKETRTQEQTECSACVGQKVLSGECVQEFAGIFLVLLQ